MPLNTWIYNTVHTLLHENNKLIKSFTALVKTNTIAVICANSQASAQMSQWPWLCVALPVTRPTWCWVVMLMFQNFTKSTFELTKWFQLLHINNGLPWWLWNRKRWLCPLILLISIQRRDLHSDLVMVLVSSTFTQGLWGRKLGSHDSSIVFLFLNRSIH